MPARHFARVGQATRKRPNRVSVPSGQRVNKELGHVDRKNLGVLVNIIVEELKKMTHDPVFLPLAAHIVTRIVTQVSKDPTIMIGVLDAAKTSATRSVGNDITRSGEIVVRTTK